MAQASSNSDTAATARTGPRGRFSVRPLRGAGLLEHTRLPFDRRRGPRSSKETTTDPAGQTAQAVALLPAWLCRLGYYGLALLFVAVAALLRSALSDVLRPTPTLVFYLAWVGAAAFGGLGPGLLATIVSWLCIDFLFDSTPGQIGFTDPTSVGRLMVLLAGGLVVSLVGEKMRRARIHERRQAEELTAANAALWASEEKYRLLVENSRDITWTVDLQGKWTFISSNMERVTGYRADELVGRVLWDFLAPESHELVKEKLRRRVRGEDLPPYEVLFVGKDGRHMPFEVLAASIVDDGGNIVGVQGVSRDITERKRAEEALRASEEKYRFLVENSKDVTWMIDLQGTWTFISGNVEKVTGYRADQVIGKTIWDFLAPECHELVKDKLRRRVRGEDLPPYEVMVVGKDGRRTPFELLTASIVNDAGNIVGVQGVSRDITERKRAEEALRESEKHYRGIVEDQTELICLFEGDATITFVNDAYCRYFGKKREELVGHKFLPLVAEEDQEAVKAQIAALNRESPFVTLEERVRRPDGSIAWQEWKNRAVFDVQGHLTGYQAVGRDITERKRAQEAVVESRKRYRGLVEKINDWVWEIDADCVYTYSSPRAQELLGYPPEEIVGKTPFDFMSPAEAQRVWSAFHSVFRERKPLELLENTLVRKDGRLVTVETSGMPVFAEDGAFLGYTGIDRDVTARKWVEEQLRRSEQDLNRAQAVAQTGSWRLDVRRNELLWSKETYRIFGIPNGTPMTYETFLAAVHPADKEYVDRQWTAALRGESYDIEHRILAEGKVKWVRERAELEFDEAGTLLGGFGTVQDVTERKRAEEALRSSQSMLQSVMENVPQGIFWKDRHSTYLGCNNVFAKAVGLESAGEIVGKTDYDLPWSPEQTASFREYDRRVMENDAPEYHIIEQQREVDGELAWLETNKVPLHDAQGNVIGILGTYEVITERKRAEEALRELNATLESKVAQRTAELEHRAWQLQKLTLELTEAEERERERLAAILHDDLQQLLVAAKFHLGLVGSGARNPRESQEIIGEVKQMLKEAIDKSRSLSHELGPAALRKGDLVEALDWLAEQMQVKHGLTVRVEAHGEVNTPSNAVKAFVYRASQELLFNVVKHARVKKAHIRIRRLSRYVCLSVSDRGQGFDPQKITKTAGFGLLNIRERAALLGGRMKIKGAEGKGTTFHIIVPETEPSRSGVEADQRADAQAE